MLSKQTHFFGKLLASDRLNCDFILLKFEVPMSMVKMEQLKQEELELAKSREVKIQEPGGIGALYEKQIE
jgi:hypothetical protein